MLGSFWSDCGELVIKVVILSVYCEYKAIILLQKDRFSQFLALWRRNASCDEPYVSTNGCTNPEAYKDKM